VITETITTWINKPGGLLKFA